MAFLQINYFSKALRRIVTLNALVPIDRMEMSENENSEENTMKSLYLLHGYTGSYMDWIFGSKIHELSHKYNVAVFMPSGENSFYLDDFDKGELFGEYIGNELIEFTRKMFHLSAKREHTWIGGLSMGGYGAIRNGLRYAKNFSRIIALSSALITDNIAGMHPDYMDFAGGYRYYTRIFGDLNKLIGSDKDPKALISYLKKENISIPKIYMACGTEDFLLNENRSYNEFLVSENVDVTYIESKGSHTWDFWNEYIEKAILWAME